jgi:hypothetical protein
MEGKIEGTRRRRRRHRQILYDLKEEKIYWNLKEEALDLLSGDLGLEQAMDLSPDKLRHE